MPTVLTLAMLASDVYADASTGATNGFRRLAPTGAMVAANCRGSSFYGAAYVGGEVGVIAFRGSAESTDWLDADVDIGLGRQPIDQWGDAHDFFNHARSLLSGQGCKRVVVTGHSLGGGLTQLVAAGVTRTPVSGVTFNAPGMGALAGNVRVRLANAANLFHYRARRDPVSKVGHHIGRAPVTVDVDIGTTNRLISSGVGAALGVLSASPLAGAAASSAAASGFEHTMAPLLDALRRGAAGGIRH